MYGCYALFVANVWTTPLSFKGDIGGANIDLAKYTYLPSGTGANITMSPIGAGGTIPPGKLGIVFLREGDPTFHTQCGYGVVAADSDMSAPTQSDPGDWGTENLATALHLATSVPAVIYDIQPFGGGRSAITDAALLFPTSAWDTSYVGVTPRPWQFGTTLPALSIVAGADGTTVTLKPTVDLNAGVGVTATKANTTTTVSLKRGQVLRLEQQTDLLGTLITANKPIGVWGEQGCITIDKQACDSAHEQLAPIHALGSEYAYARYPSRDGTDEKPPTRLTGAVDGTVLAWDPVPPGAKNTLNRGESLEIRTSTPFVVHSQDDQHPFYMATYMTGGESFNFGIGDPEFVSLVPSAQYLSQYTFFTDPTYPETSLVFFRRKGTDGQFHDVFVDCAGTIGGWSKVGAAGSYETTRVSLSSGNFQGSGACDNGLHEAHSDGPFTATVWAWGTSATSIPTGWVSYAYPLGAGVQRVNTVNPN
jgi:hypothetical protein